MGSIEVKVDSAPVLASRRSGHGPQPRRRRRWRDRPPVVAAGFLAPGIAALLLLRVAPLLEALWQSFYRTGAFTGITQYVGFANYSALFADPVFRQSVAVTLLFTLIINPFQVALALAFAVLFNKPWRGARFFRSLVFASVATPPAVSALIWGQIYQSNGLANSFLHVLGLPPQPFVSSSSQALVSVIIMLSWIGVGYWMMFLIAGLRDIPVELTEAAAIDGANAWQRFRRVTLPLLRRPLTFVLVADTVANFLVFAQIQILTNGGPNGSTNLIMYDIYTRAFTEDVPQTAYAEVILLAILTIVIVSIQFRLLQPKDAR
jgi:multiple sugar transport system permease protein